MWVTRSISASGRAARRNSSSVEHAWRVLAGDGEDGAVALGDAVGAVADRLDRRQVAVLVEDLGQLGDLGGEAALAGQAGRGALDAVVAPVLEGAGDRAGRHVAEQLVGQLAVGPREQRLGGRGDAVDPLAAALLARAPGPPRRPAAARPRRAR